MGNLVNSYALIMRKEHSKLFDRVHAGEPVAQTRTGAEAPVFVY
jgi:antitoxin (DNA-binding transcriptional repressor) of toxin-antitoxin stability system